MEADGACVALFEMVEDTVTLTPSTVALPPVALGVQAPVVAARPGETKESRVPTSAAASCAARGAPERFPSRLRRAPPQNAQASTAAMQR